jgi:hypothetical protein
VQLFSLFEAIRPLRLMVEIRRDLAGAVAVSVAQLRACWTR